jgi:nucleotide-binding universal stress UspA family protein
MGARQFDAELVVLHTHFFEPPKYFVPDNAETIIASLKRAKEDVRDSLEQYAGKILGPMADGVKMDFKVMDHHPAQAIMRAIRQGNCDLIVMGTHGLRGVKRFFMGSITESIVRESPVPVFTIRQKVHDFIDVQNPDAIPHLKRVLCPWNLNSTSRPALDMAVSIADRFKAGLTVLYIREADAEPDVDEILDQICAEAGDINDYPCPVEIKVRQGNGAEEIVRQAQEYQEDMIVLAAVHKSFLEETFLGRTVELVMRHAPVPVLITPISQPMQEA